MANSLLHPSNLNTAYFICSTPRTGSGLLERGLAKTKLCGNPIEYFNPRRMRFWAKKLEFDYQTDAEYIRSIIQATMSDIGVWGAKVHFDQFLHMITLLRDILDKPQLKEVELINMAFPNVRYIHISRRDKILQGISYHKAMRTGKWAYNSVTQNEVREEDLAYDLWALEQAVEKMYLDDLGWQMFFQENEIEPLHLVYEDFVDTYQQTVQNTLLYLNIPEAEKTQIPPPTMKVQSNELNDKWYAQYAADKGWLSNKVEMDQVESGNILPLLVKRIDKIHTTYKSRIRILKARAKE